MQNLKEIYYSSNLDPLPNPDLLFLSATMTLQCLPAGISTFSSCLTFVIVTSCVPTARPPWALFSYKQTYYIRVTQNEPRQNNLMLLRRDMLRCARQPTIIRPLAAGDAKWGSCRAWSEDWQEKTIKIGCRRAAILKEPTHELNSYYSWIIIYINS